MRRIVEKSSTIRILRFLSMVWSGRSKGGAAERETGSVGVEIGGDPVGKAGAKTHQRLAVNLADA